MMLFYQREDNRGERTSNKEKSHPKNGWLFVDSDNSLAIGQVIQDDAAEETGRHDANSRQVGGKHRFP